MAGLGAVEDIRAWLAQVMSWARSNWGAEEAKAVESIALDPASQAYHAEGIVDPEFDTALHYALVGDLHTTTMQFLGVAATGTSGLRVLQVLMQPVLGAKGHTSRQQAIVKSEEYPACHSRAVLLEWLQGLEQLCTLLASVGQTSQKRPRPSCAAGTSLGWPQS